MFARFRSCSLPFLLVLASLLDAGSAAAQTWPEYTRWILAEGAANHFFDEDIVIANPGPDLAQVTVRLRPGLEPGETEAPPEAVITVAVPPHSRRTVRVADHVAPPGQAPGTNQIRPGAVSAVVESGTIDNPGPPIVVERTMTWIGGSRQGTHATQGVLEPSDTWYLAEGVGGFFDTFILITNTNETQAANVEVQYLLEEGAPITETLTIPARGRQTIYVNEKNFGFAFSTVVRQTDGGGRADLVVERAMYWNGFDAGHGSAGVTDLSDTWLFAEGVTGGDSIFQWSTFLLLANPSPNPVDVTVTFFRENAPAVSITLSGTTAPDPQLRRLEPNSRRTLDLASLRFPNGERELASGSFGIRVEATAPILAERAVYWSAGGVTFLEGHNTPGLTDEASAWAFAEGREGRFPESGSLSHDTFFLLSNSSGQNITVLATFLREDGLGFQRTVQLPAQQRVPVNTSEFPGLWNQRFSAFFQAVDAQGTPITSQTFTAERVVYWGAPFPWFAGHAATGTPWTAGVEAPDPIPGPVVTSVTPPSGLTSGGTEILVRGENFAETSTVLVGGQPATGVVVVDTTTLYARVPASASPGAVPVCVQTPQLPEGTCLPGGFTYILPEPMTTVPDSLAFGDSITHGIQCFFVSPGFACAQTTSGNRYPNRLQALLAERYSPRQTITVQNAGIPGECASVRCTSNSPSSGRERLPGTISAAHDLVIILQGVNDLNAGRSADSIRRALTDMVKTARTAGKRVIVCSLTPVVTDVFGSYHANPGRVAELNAQIAAMAAAEGVPYVDLVAAFGSNPRQYLGDDGMHPNNAGYRRIAEAIRDRIVQAFEVR